MPILSNNPSTLSKTAADLKAELAAMEEEEAAEARCKQEREEKKKKLAELAEARKAEEAAAAEAARKAAKKAAKRQADTQGPDEANENRSRRTSSTGQRSWHGRGVIGAWPILLFDFSSSNSFLDVSCKRWTAYEPRDREAQPASRATK